MVFLWEETDSSIAAKRGYRLDDRGSIPDRSKTFSFLSSVQTASGPHAASYPKSTRGYFSGSKAAWS
jgi:hypothetical protein